MCARACVHVQTKDQGMSNAALEAELQAVREAKEKEREQLEAQLTQQREESLRAQDKLQVDNKVRATSGFTHGLLRKYLQSSYDAYPRVYEL